MRREELWNDRTAARRLLFRGMSATDSERTRKSGRLAVGISGRVPSEWVADLRRNQWPAWVGIRTSLYAALNVASGTVVGACSARHTGADFVRFLNVLTRQYRTRELHVVLDNSSTHNTPDVRAWLETHPRVHFHFTPTGASWLNMVEAWFSILTRKSVRRGSFDTARALITHIQRYLTHWTVHPTPFVWTKDPAAIIKKALRRAP